ncbi:MAG: FCD domain-containing protein [Trueperaceae bacterium]
MARDGSPRIRRSTQSSTRTGTVAIAPSDLRDLESLWSQVKALPLNALDEYLDLDMTFHQRMCTIAANPALTQMWTILFGTLRA